MSRFEIVCVVLLAIGGAIFLVGSRFIVEQQRVIDTVSAENDSLRAAADTTKAYELGYDAGYESGLTAAVWYAKRAPSTAYSDTIYVHKSGWQYHLTPADSAGVRTINDLFLRVRELERRCK